MHDAYSVAQMIVEDHFARTRTTQPLLLREDLQGRVVDLQAWERIDAAEVQRGRERGKEREKFRTVEEMLAVLD